MTRDSGKGQGVSVKPLGMVSSTGQPSPKGAVAVAVEGRAPLWPVSSVCQEAPGIYIFCSISWFLSDGN